MLPLLALFPILKWYFDLLVLIIYRTLKLWKFKSGKWKLQTMANAIRSHCFTVFCNPLDICDSGYISAKREIRCFGYISLHFSGDMLTITAINALQMRLYWTAQCYLQHDIELPVACFTAVSKLNLRWLPLNSMFNFLQKLKVTAKSWLCWLMHMSWQSGNELCLINGDKMYSYSVNNYTNPYPKPNR